MIFAPHLTEDLEASSMDTTSPVDHLFVLRKESLVDVWNLADIQETDLAAAAEA